MRTTSNLSKAHLAPLDLDPAHLYPPSASPAQLRTVFARMSSRAPLRVASLYDDYQIVLNNVYVAPTAFDVHIQSPVFHDGHYPYRDFISAYLSLSGTALRRYNSVVFEGGQPALPGQLVLTCFAACGSCSSLNSKCCHPIRFFLSPKSGRRYNKGFKLDRSSNTLTGVVTFDIVTRPVKPKPGDPTRRCAEEALQLTYVFRDWEGVTVAQNTVGPFKVRVHKAQQPAAGPDHAPLAVLPVEYSAAEAPCLSCPCPYCPYRTAQHL